MTTDANSNTLMSIHPLMSTDLGRIQKKGKSLVRLSGHSHYRGPSHRLKKNFSLPFNFRSAATKDEDYYTGFLSLIFFNIT